MLDGSDDLDRVLRTALLELDVNGDVPGVTAARRAWGGRVRRRRILGSGLASFLALAVALVSVLSASDGKPHPRFSTLVASPAPTPTSSPRMQDPHERPLAGVVHTGRRLIVPSHPMLGTVSHPPRVAELDFWITRDINQDSNDGSVMLWAGWQASDGTLVGVSATGLPRLPDPLTTPGFHGLFATEPQVDAYLNPAGTFGILTGGDLDHVTYDDGGTAHPAELYPTDLGVQIVFAPVDTKLGNVFHAYDQQGLEHFHYLSEGYDVPSYAHSGSSDTAPPTAATATYEGQGLRFAHPTSWKVQHFKEQLVGSFSSVLLYVSTDPLHDPCTANRRAGGGTSYACTTPLTRLSAKGVLITWTTNRFPHYSPPATNATFNGHKAIATYGRADATCRSLRGKYSTDLKFPRGNGYLEMNACFAAAADESGMKAIFETVSF